MTLWRYGLVRNLEADLPSEASAATGYAITEMVTWCIPWSDWDSGSFIRESMLRTPLANEVIQIVRPMTPPHLYHGRHIEQVRGMLLAGNNVSAAEWIELELGKDDERFGVGKIAPATLELNSSGGVDFMLYAELPTLEEIQALGLRPPDGMTVEEYIADLRGEE